MMPTLLTVLAENLFHLLALPVSRSLTLVWTWTYTAAVPEHLRAARRAEMRSDLYEQINQMRQEGNRSNIIAFHILGRMIWGLWDDMRWSAPYLPSTLAERLSRGSDTVGRVRPSPSMLASLTMFGIMNVSLHMADRTVPWFEWVYLNTMIPVVALLLKNQQHRWVRRLFQLWISLFIVLAVTLILWVILEYRLYQMPHFYEFLLLTILAALPMIVALGVATKTVRTYVFRDKWWPVAVTWVVIGGAYVAAWATVGGNLAISFGITVLTALIPMLVLILGLVVAFAFGVKVVCYAGIRGAAGCMRLTATGIRRLERST